MKLIILFLVVAIYLIIAEVGSYFYSTHFEED